MLLVAIVEQARMLLVKVMVAVPVDVAATMLLRERGRVVQKTWFHVVFN